MNEESQKFLVKSKLVAIKPKRQRYLVSDRYGKSMAVHGATFATTFATHEEAEQAIAKALSPEEWVIEEMPEAPF